ncbi:uncharacterized protein BJ212DRAFT_1354796 [Suillus subaureus]|uniref:Uncharacterized protein n=1 Tax=Suillus subaureus TaxID=48587 RepID=A0A9P7EBC9_9AGAM|nr:uncharacterized protein BJ212DRAFT_1354796 [Suillus subaureus]KAG1816451.1 hypothetical protein BJ212DRAFT_1354796 [Suillus subaureus]
MITHTKPRFAQAAHHGFQPFMADSSKQKPEQALEKFAKEISDYAKSAALFHAVSGATAGRFTSAVCLDLGTRIISGLHTPAAQLEEGADSMDVALNWACDARGVYVAASAAAVQVLWRQGLGSGSPCRYLWVVSAGYGA